jgi:GNAT superfamily N-acetyltransferase
MTIDLRPACSDDYVFALNLYLKAIKPLAIAWMEWVDQDQEAQFASLWRPYDTRIITLDGREDIGWVEFRQTGDEIFLKQLYISPEHRRGIGSQVMRLLLLEEQRGTAQSMALFVLKNNPAFRFYERHGFEVVRETHTTFVMRQELSINHPCPHCGRTRTLRPDVVWFDEVPLHMTSIVEGLAQADLFVSISTSGSVYPVAGFVEQAKDLGIRTCEINLEPSGNARLFDQASYGPATQAVPAWIKRVLAS